MKQFIALATIPMLIAPAVAAPYVESKTTGAVVDGDYSGAQTELRVGYEQKLENGTTLVLITKQLLLVNLVLLSLLAKVLLLKPRLLVSMVLIRKSLLSAVN
jgi:hypothetical protein